MLKLRKATASGAEVAEVAVCLAIGEHDPVILAYPARGARMVRKGCKSIGKNGEKLATALLSAVAALLGDPNATALVCAGKLENNLDYRKPFSFAARHKLPVLFLISNTITPERPQELDLRTLYAEFGIPVFSVDANDAIAAYRVATEAIHNARLQRGPCIIEALTLNTDKVGGAASPLTLLRDYMERHGNPPLL